MAGAGGDFGGAGAAPTMPPKPIRADLAAAGTNRQASGDASDFLVRVASRAEAPSRLPLPNPRRVLQNAFGKKKSGEPTEAGGGPGTGKRSSSAIVPPPPNVCTDLDKAGIVADAISPISGEGGCLIENPIRYARVGKKYSVGLSTPAISNCGMARQFVAWLDEVAQAAALKVYDQPVVRVTVAASYVCRPVNDDASRSVSQHGLGNAIDISEFVFADGTSVSVLFGWADEGKGQTFLRQVHAQACRYFSTVIGPDGDRWHTDHIHLDLGRHGSRGTARHCK